MTFRLDEAGIDLLRRLQHDLFLGVLEISSGTISLFIADRLCDPAKRTFRGHEDLLDCKVIPSKGMVGFSFQLKQGKIFRFYRNSVLNNNLPFYCLSDEDMDKIIEVCGLQVANDFESYP
jgi:hypothetical protein